MDGENHLRVTAVMDDQTDKGEYFDAENVAVCFLASLKKNSSSAER